MSVLTFILFRLNTLQKNRQTLSQSKPWCKWCVEFSKRLLYHDIDVKEVVSSQPSIEWYKSANQRIGIRIVE